MDSVAGIISELVDVQGLLKNKNLSEENKTGMMNQISAKILSLRNFNAASAAKLFEALDAASMAQSFHDMMKDAINRRMADSGPATRSKVAGVQPQLLSNILHYLTEQDWDIISVVNCPPNKIISILAARLSKLQLDSLDEQTKKECIKLVLHLRKASTGAVPKFKIIYGWVNDLKMQHEALKVPRTCTFLQRYPPLPSQLPRDIFAAAYQGSDQPVSKDVENFHAYGAHIPLRSNSALLKREATQDSQSGTVTWEQLVALQNTGQVPGLPGFRMLQPGGRPSLMPLQDRPQAQLALQDAHQDHGPTERFPGCLSVSEDWSDPSTPNARHIGTAGLQFKPALPRRDIPAPAVALGAAGSEGGKPDVAAGDLEDEVLAGFKGRDGAKKKKKSMLKKPAMAAADSDEDLEESSGDGEDEAEKPKTLKRPAAALLKRPAAAVLKRKLFGVDCGCKKADQKRYASRESFACAVRQKALKVAAVTKLNKADTKELMSTAYRAASASWDKA